MKPINIAFESDYRKKVLFQKFGEPTTLDSVEAVASWRQEWTRALKSWHSPYKSLIDCTNLKVSTDSEVHDSLERMKKFLEGFFLQKAVAFCAQPTDVAGLPFPVVDSLEEAYKLVGIREDKSRQPGDFRSSIVLKNDFRLHVMELEFTEPVIIDSNEKIQVLKSKISNNIMQWHSKWNLLVDCNNLEIGQEFFEDFETLEKYFRGFFLKIVVGYQPANTTASYPFKVFRSRHKAVQLLESEGLIAGDLANCQSRK